MDTCGRREPARRSQSASTEFVRRASRWKLRFLVKLDWATECTDPSRDLFPLTLTSSTLAPQISVVSFRNVGDNCFAVHLPAGKSTGVFGGDYTASVAEKDRNMSHIHVD